MKKYGFIIAALLASVAPVNICFAEQECEYTYENNVIIRKDCDDGSYQIYDSTGSYVIEMHTDDGDYYYYDAPGHATKWLGDCYGGPDTCTRKRIYTDEGSVEQLAGYDSKDNPYNSIAFYNTNDDIILRLSTDYEGISVYDNGKEFSYDGGEIYLNDTSVSIDEIKNATGDILRSSTSEREVCDDDGKDCWDEEYTINYRISSEGDNKKLYINDELAFQFEIDDDHLTNIKDADGMLYNLDFDFDIETSIPSLASFKQTPAVPVKELRRIYTVEEAAALVKPTGNTFRIKYK